MEGETTYTGKLSAKRNRPLRVRVRLLREALNPFNRKRRNLRLNLRK